jgi:hypothetical protein
MRAHHLEREGAPHVRKMVAKCRFECSLQRKGEGGGDTLLKVLILW